MTLLELVVVLAILTALGTVMITQTAGLTGEARYEQTVRIVEQIEAAVLGEPNLRGPDGQRLITGFVADMGRLPDTLDELWLIGTAEAFAVDKSPAGDPTVTLAAGWRGPYIRLPVGADTLTDGWGRAFDTLDEDGDDTTLDIKMVRSRGLDIAVGGTGFERDLPLVFEASAVALTNANLDGVDSVVPARFEGGVRVDGVVADDGSGGTEAPGNDPGTPAANFVVIRVYGPDPLTGGVQTVAQEIVDLNDPVVAGEVSLTALPAISGGDVTIGTRVIRAYQVVASPATPNSDLFTPATNVFRVSEPVYFVNPPGGLSQPLPALVLEVP